MARQVYVAENAGFCFGVQRAVNTTLYENQKKSSKVFTLGPLIHNDDVVKNLAEQGISQISTEDIERLGPEDALVIRSHGVTPEIFERIMKTGAKIIDATCPYVASIQRKARKYYEEGYQIVIVGDPNHPEVIGINGCCNNTAIITRNGDELNNLPDRVCILSQTTERQSNFEKTREIVSKKCKDMLAFNTICSATRERQDSAEQISKTVDLMIVIGGRHSSNTKKLYEVCSANCKTLLIENKQELPDWVRTDLQLERIGVTAGASTPDWIIDEIVDIISLIADDRVIQEESD